LRAGVQSVRRAEIEKRLRFETLLTDVCAQFVNVAPSDVDSKIEDAQRLICESLRINHSSVWQVSEENSDPLVMTHAYRDRTLEPLPSRPVLREYFPWIQAQIQKKQVVCIPNTANVPPEAAKDMQSWQQYGVRSALAFPLSVGGGPVIGLLAFDSTEERDWPEPLQRRLQLLAHVIAQALERKEAERKMRDVNRALAEQTALLQTREELLKIFVKNAPVGVAMFDRDMRYLQVSDRWCADYGVESSQILGRSQYEMFPDLPERWKEVHRRGLAGETLRADEDRWDRADGTKWVRWEIRPWWNLDSLPGGILIFAEDITNRKQTEEALSGMTRKLVEAQEQERARIARDLHDDITQRLAMLAIDIEEVETPPDIQEQMHELSERTKEITSDIQALSHELHSAKLDYLGIAGGMRSWCSEFGERKGMEIEFNSSELPDPLPPEISLCLFRVLQEALHNASKHSGAKRADVELRVESGEIHLTVSDLGKGFDVAAAMQGRGLGVTSMQERVRLLAGRIVIDSQPLVGTTIQVHVPLGAERSY